MKHLIDNKYNRIICLKCNKFFCSYGALENRFSGVISLRDFKFLSTNDLRYGTNINTNAEYNLRYNNSCIISTKEYKLKLLLK